MQLHSAYRGGWLDQRKSTPIEFDRGRPRHRRIRSGIGAIQVEGNLHALNGLILTCRV
jgi:hypothetical protein